VSRARYMVGVAALSAVVVSGCGSSSKNSSSSSSSSITKTDFLAKGNAICRAGDARLNAASAKLGNNPSKTQIIDYVTKTFLPQIQGDINGIRALGAPKGDEATVSGFLSLAQADLDKIKSNPVLVVTGGPALFHNFAAKAHPYGLTACAARS
jgi:hypothetical protein